MRVYSRVLKAVFKEAWKECWFVLDCGDAPLKWARESRTALWWETTKAIMPQAKRRRMGLQRSQAGRPAPGWENPFVVVWGIHWREQRSSCSSIQKWMAKFAEFTNALAAVWGLVWLSDESATLEDDEAAWHTVKLPARISDMVISRPNRRCSDWGGGGGKR